MFREEENEADIFPLLDDVLPNGKGLILMLKVYLDRGAREDAQGVMCVAAAVFKPTPYKQFVREWKGLFGSVPFHATDFYGGGGDFQDIPPKQRSDMAKLIPTIIDKHVMQVIAVTFKEQEFEVVAPANWKARFGSLHGVAVQLCLDALGHHLDRKGNHTPVAYFIETGDEESYLDALFQRVAKLPDRKKHWRYASHTFAAKGVARGLEVADCFAWQWDKYYAETLARPVREMRKDLRAMIEKHPKKRNRLLDARPASGDDPPRCLSASFRHRLAVLSERW